MANDVIKDWNEFPELSDLEFDMKVRQYRDWHKAEQEAKARKDELKVDIEAALMVAGQKKLKVGNLLAIACTGSTASKIDKHLLVMNGVDVDVIKNSTVKGTSYSYIQVRAEDEEATPIVD